MESEIKKEEKIKEQNDGIIIRPIRTLQDDISNLVKDNKVSKTSIVLAEQKRRLAENKKPENEVSAINVAPRTESEDESIKPLIIKTFLSIVLLVGGFYSLYFLYDSNIIQNKIKDFTEEKIIIEDYIVKQDNSLIINTKDKRNSDIKNEIENYIINNNNSTGLTEIQIVKEKINNENKTEIVLIDTIELLNIIKTNTNNKIIRSLDSKFFLGIDNKNETPVLILKTNDFSVTFAEMFDWEKTLYLDFENIIYKKTEVIDENLSNINENKNKLLRFEDVIYLNQDARAIIDKENNKIKIMYGFVDDKYLVITSNEETFKEIVRQLRIVNLRR